MKTRSVQIALVLVIALGLAACEPQQSDRGTGQATVVAVDAAKREVTLDHGEIPGMMMAMTMTFAVSDPALLANLAPGAQVEFDVEMRDGAHVVTGIRPK
jgi:Cu/Ag efflux protein CusF